MMRSAFGLTIAGIVVASAFAIAGINPPSSGQPGAIGGGGAAFTGDLNASDLSDTSDGIVDATDPVQVNSSGVAGQTTIVDSYGVRGFPYDANGPIINTYSTGIFASSQAPGAAGLPLVIGGGVGVASVTVTKANCDGDDDLTITLTATGAETFEQNGVVNPWDCTGAATDAAAATNLKAAIDAVYLVPEFLTTSISGNVITLQVGIAYILVSQEHMTLSKPGGSTALALVQEGANGNTSMMGGLEIETYLKTWTANSLNLRSGVQFSDLGPKGACNATFKGTLWYDASGAGVEDEWQVCYKNAADGYAWRDLLSSSWVGTATSDLNLATWEIKDDSDGQVTVEAGDDLGIGSTDQIWWSTDLQLGRSAAGTLVIGDASGGDGAALSLGGFGKIDTTTADGYFDFKTNAGASQTGTIAALAATFSRAPASGQALQMTADGAYFEFGAASETTLSQFSDASTKQYFQVAVRDTAGKRVLVSAYGTLNDALTSTDELSPAIRTQSNTDFGADADGINEYIAMRHSGTGVGAGGDGAGILYTGVGDIWAQPQGDDLCVYDSGGVTNVCLGHDGTDSNLVVSAGDLKINPAGGDVMVTGNIDMTGRMGQSGSLYITTTQTPNPTGPDDWVDVISCTAGSNHIPDFTNPSNCVFHSNDAARLFIHMQASFTGTAGDEYRIGIAKSAAGPDDTAPVTECIAARDTNAAGGMGTATVFCIIDVAAGDEVWPRITNHDNANDPTLAFMTFMFHTL